MKTMILMTLAFALSACATKRYGRMLEVNDFEARNLTCEQIDFELAEVDAFRSQIDNAQVDFRSVAGFLGDYGIGNAMEKGDARKSAQLREDSLRALSREKGC